MPLPCLAKVPPLRRPMYTHTSRASCFHVAAKPPRHRRHPRRAIPMRRRCGARAPREPHGCYTHAPPMRRASAEFLTHIACTKPAKTSGIRQPCAAYAARETRSDFASRVAHKGRGLPLRPLPGAAASCAPGHLDPRLEGLPDISSQAQAKSKPNQA